MPIRLTEQQQQALDSTDAQPPQVVDPRTNAAYVLIPLTEYQAVREVFEDERRQRAIRAIALRNAGRRADEAPLVEPGEVYIADFPEAGADQVTMAQAARLAGLPLEGFIELLGQAGIDAVSYPPEDLEDEVKAAG